MTKFDKFFIKILISIKKGKLMKVKNIKFANTLKKMIYKTFLETQKHTNYNFCDTEELERKFEKTFLEGKNIDDLKDKTLISFENDKKIKKISIRDLFINLGNKLVKENKIINFIEQNKQNAKNQVKSYKKYGIKNFEAEKNEKILFEFLIFNELFGIEYSDFENNKTIDNIKINNININKKKLIESFRKVIYEFIENYYEILKYSNNPWADITLNDIDKNNFNIITDTRFLSEINAINKNNIKHKKVLLIKTKNEKLDSYDINQNNIEKYYQYYKNSKTINEFEDKIKNIANPAEKLSILLTLHEYLKHYPNKKFFFNTFLEKDIKKNIGNYKIIFNEYGNMEKLKQEAINLANIAKKNNKHLIVLIANRKTGKDTFMKFIKEYLENNELQNNIQKTMKFD